MSKKRPLLLRPFKSYGTDHHLYAHGRALEDKGVKFGLKQSVFRTIKNIYKQLESNEIKNAPIELELSDGRTYKTTTDGEGYFKFDQEVENLSKLATVEGLIQLTFRYQEIPLGYEVTNENTFDSQLLIPSKEAVYGVISDIDDTILETGVSSLFKWKLLFNTIFKNYDQRIPLKDAPGFYRQLHHTADGKPINPLFYVSNSPWNLYTYLNHFLEVHKFPKGPVLLRDFWTPFDGIAKPKVAHKRRQILHLLDTYPNMRFILIGDSGEKDPIYYSEIADRYPDRIIAIYVRSVKHKRKRKLTLAFMENYTTVPMLLVDDSKEIEAHLKSIGFPLPVLS